MPPIVRLQEPLSTKKFLKITQFRACHPQAKWYTSYAVKIIYGRLLRLLTRRNPVSVGAKERDMKKPITFLFFRFWEH
jgi:hypothetical protein